MKLKHLKQKLYPKCIECGFQLPPLYGSHICGVCESKKGLKVPATHEDVAVGAWLSAALEDDQVCDEMKKDVNAWFDSKIYPRESGDE